MVFPDGTDWDGEQVKAVIGIAGVGEEHLKILSVVAEMALEDDFMEHLVSASAQEVYEMLKGGKVA